MKLPQFRRIRAEDIEEAPSWFSEKVLGIFNEFLDVVYRTLDRQTTLGEQVPATFRDLDVRTGSSYSSGEFQEIRFPSGLSRAASAVMVSQVFEVESNDPIQSGAAWVDWREVQGQIRIRWISGLDDDKRFTVRVIVL